MLSLKDRFISDWQKVNEEVVITYIVVGIHLPNGAIEIITNTMDLDEKFSYYLETYDDHLKMYKNQNIYIMNWMFV